MQKIKEFLSEKGYGLEDELTSEISDLIEEYSEMRVEFSTEYNKSLLLEIINDTESSVSERMEGLKNLINEL